MYNEVHCTRETLQWRFAEWSGANIAIGTDYISVVDYRCTVYSML